MRVVLVDPRIRTRSAGLADPAVADRLERAPRVPQLDDPDVGVVDAVDDRLVVVDDDDVGAGEQPRQAHAIEEASALGDAGLEERQEFVLAVQPSFDHPVVDDLEVAPELRARVGAEQDPPAGPAGGRSEDPEQHAEQAQAQDLEWPQEAPQRRGGGRGQLRGVLRILQRDVERDRTVVRIDRRHRPELAAATEREAAAVTCRIDPLGVGHHDRDGGRAHRARAADEPPSARCQRHLAGPLHDVEAQPKVVALERAAGRRHLERRASVPPVRLVPKAERHRVATGRRDRGGVRIDGRRASLDDPLHPFPGEREEVDARRVEAGVLSGRMRQWPFLSAGDDTRRRPHRPPTTSVRAGRPAGDPSIVRRRRRA